MRRPLLAFLLVLTPATLHAGLQHPNIERGFAADKAFQVGDIDNVNLFNGNLVLTIPIGHPYPAGAGLSYGLTLTYNSKLWDFEEICYPPPGGCRTRAFPMADANAGLGWQLQLGRLVPPRTPPRNPSEYWMYLSPDGGEHLFYRTLHNTDPRSEFLRYTRDGSYLRLTVGGTEKTVEFPDGAVHSFDSSGRLKRIEDRHGNAVTVTYSVPGGADDELWTLTDSFQRRQRVYLQYRFLDGVQVLTVDRVELEEFANTTATYRFTYEQAAVERPCPWNDDAGQSSFALVPLLTGVELPDGSSYSTSVADYHLDRSNGCRKPGALASVQLPTLGSVEWRWGTYRFATGEATPGSTVPPRLLDKSLGVKRRRLFNAADTLVGEWTYEPVLEQIFGEEPVEMTNTVTTPLGDVTVHYFSAYLGGNTSVPEAECSYYGLPFSARRGDGGGRFLSRQVFDGGTLMRSSYVRYEEDFGACSSAEWNANRRLAEERTVYHDDGDSYTEMELSDFDGLGNYRRRTTGGSFGPAGSRVSYTDYNPDAGTYPGSFVLPAPTAPWILTDFTEQWSQENGEVERRELCVDDATGLITRQRIWEGTSRGNDDVLVVYDHDTRGQTTGERYYGGDLQWISAGSNLCNLGLPASPQYQLVHGYEYGTLATSEYVGAGYKHVDRDVDPSTSFVATSRDSAGLTTDYEFDLLGRLTWVKPQTGHGSWIQYGYFAATSPTSLAWARVNFRDNGSKSAPVLAREEYAFDAFGRLAEERRQRPGGAMTRQQTRYDAEGRRSKVSSWYTGTPQHWTSFLDYDPFGRPREIEPPDGAAHSVHLGYLGVRRVTRKVKVGTFLQSDGSVGETEQTTTEHYDPQGRLWKVVEPAGGVTAEYSYDAGQRLEEVELYGPVTQRRTFTYDGRGFLNQESHPESGTTQYLDYDPLGNAHRKLTAGGDDLVYSYDAAARLTEIKERGATGRVLEDRVYATTNGSGNWKRGKLERAARHNIVTIPWAPTIEADLTVTETYSYGGRDGRVSARTTKMTSTALVETGNTDQEFVQSWQYDALGQVTRLTYPRCVHTPCVPDAGPPRIVNFQYDDGHLTGISGYASAISYHPDGRVKQVTRNNATTDTITADPWGMSRPRDISVVGSWGTTTLGTHRYDGAGNLVQVGDLSRNTYLYDGLNRLKKFTFSSGEWQEYTFDPYGNLTRIRHFDGSSTTTRSYTTSTATNRLTAGSYDGDGNLTWWSGERWEYDAFNMIKHRNFPDEIYAYTADGERLLSARYQGPEDPLEESWTLRDLDGKVLTVYRMVGGNNPGDWSWEKDYVHRDGQLLATETAEPYPWNRQFFSLDHLGTPRLTTGANGQPLESHHYFGFGEELRASQDPERMRFTGHERDRHDRDGAGTGDDLDYMHARYYSPIFGRFLSVDPVGGTLPTPQSWNRYSYVLNNPLSFIDPLGLTECTAQSEESLSCYDTITVTAHKPFTITIPTWLVTNFFVDVTPHVDGDRFDFSDRDFSAWEAYNSSGDCSSDFWCQVFAEVGSNSLAVTYAEFGLVSVTGGFLGGMLRVRLFSNRRFLAEARMNPFIYLTILRSGRGLCGRAFLVAGTSPSA